AEKWGNSIPAIESEDSLRMFNDDGSIPLDRIRVKRIQTPQVFFIKEILNAYTNAGTNDFTDDASVFEAYGGEIHIVEGNKENLKLTYPSDLHYASVLLEK
ncbi:2-C-methyl-D-erythritol 4-phosphate cytidylyltransferase, partial [Bacteroidota bacterium]